MVEWDPIGVVVLQERFGLLDDNASCDGRSGNVDGAVRIHESMLGSDGRNRHLRECQIPLVEVTGPPPNQHSARRPPAPSIETS
jgi:hypothetical protein